MARRKGRLTTNASNLAPINFPVGTILAYGGTVNGTSNVSNFNLPDLRGRTLRGPNSMGTPQGSVPRDGTNRYASVGGSPTGIGSVQDDHTRRPRVSDFGTNTTGSSHDHAVFIRGSGSDNPNGAVTYIVTNSAQDGAGSGTDPIGIDVLSTRSEHTHGITGGDTESTMKNIAQNFIIKI